MNQLFKQIVAFSVAAMMLLGMVPATVQAVETPSRINSSVAPFSSTDDLIQQVKEQLIAQGKFQPQQAASQAAVEAVEKESTYSFDEAQTLITMGLLSNKGTQGVIDTARLNLSADAMQALLDDTLKTYYLEGSVTVEAVEENGIVTSVNYTTTDTFAQVVEEVSTNAGQTTLQPMAEEAPLPFTDVNANFWGVPFIRYVYENGLMNGTGDNEFSPLDKLSRAMVVTVLWRIAGSPEPQGEAKFTDLGTPHAGNSWYFKPIAWAQENSIASGLTATTFGPNENVTRQQMVTFLGRFAEYCGLEVPAEGDVSTFKDANRIEPYAVPYVAWAAANGIVNGYEDGTFQPWGESLRVEFAKIITVFHRDLMPGEDDPTDPSACQHGNIVAHAEVPAGCETEGMQAYYECPDCGLVLDAQGNYVADKAALVIPATGHKPTTVDDIAWNWVRKVDYYFATDENGNPTFDQGNVDADGNPVPDFPIDPDTQQPVVQLFFDPDTGAVTPGYQEIISWLCDTAEYDCYSCGKHFTEDTTVSSYILTEDLINEKAEAYGTQVAMELITAYVEEKAMAYYMETGAAPTEEMTNAWVAEAQQDAELMGKVEQEATLYGYQLAYDMESTFYVATYGEGDAAVSNEYNATADQLKRDWAIMTSFNRYYPEYFGLVAPYWSSKNTETSPLGAVIYMCSMEEQPLIPNVYLDMMVSMLPQAFMSYVMQYSTLMDAMLADAMATVNYKELDTVDKLLLLHDWLAKYATFDMQGLVDITNGTSEGSDPISMTAFGLLLNDQIPKTDDATWDGGICMAYAATYAMLVQQAFGVDQDDEAIVDFAKIQYLSNVSESSVAAGDSGFGDGDAMFNSAHYMNAVKVDGQWYYVDACYDDVNTEVISQYRVETEGNVSHGSFLLSPASWETMYEGNFQYMDSLYDGKVWNRVPDGAGGYQKRDAEGNLYTQAEADELQAAAEEKGETIQMFFVYEATDTTAETRYEDTTYEEAWFVGANSAINYDPATQYFYYTTGSISSYASMKDLFGGSDDSGNGGMGDYMDMEDMMAYKDDPAYHDRLVRRSVTAPNEPETDDSNDQFSMMTTTDTYAEVLFHYGYGDIGASANDKFVADSEEEFDFSFGDEDEETPDYSITEDQKGPYYDSHMAEDEYYTENYPDLVHSTVVMDGKLYFNIGTGIYTFNMTIDQMARQDIDRLTNLELVAVKEYDEITYTSNGRRFTGMSFEASEEGETLRYHPIAALSVAKDFKNEGVETLFVSVATNLTNSYKDANGDAYTVEARNYNPDTFRFMEEDEESADENDNVEFMWSANIIDKMPVEELLADLSSGATETVSVAAYCRQDAYTQTRTTKFGLVKGEANVQEGTALDHDYAMDSTEGVYICARCLEAHEHSNESYTGADIAITWAKTADGTGLTATAELPCATDAFCPLNDGITCTVSGPDANGVYTATAKLGNLTKTETMTLNLFDHSEHTYGEPTFSWNDDGTVTATFVCTEAGRLCEIEEDQTVNVLCDVAEADGHLVAACQSPDGKTYQDIKHVYTYGEATWGEDHETCTRTGTCACGETIEDRASITLDTENSTDATCTEDGVVAFVATFASNGDVVKDEVVTEATGHDLPAFGAPVWADDYSTCTRSAVCGTCGEAVVEEAEVAAPVTVPATCTEEGSTTYTAVFEDDITDTKVVTIPATGHTTVAAYAWDDDLTKCVQTKTCSVCGDEVSTETATGTAIEYATVDATCATDGSKTATATFSDGETATKTVTIPATGDHNDADGDGKCDSCGADVEVEVHEHTFTVVDKAGCMWYNIGDEMYCSFMVRCACGDEDAWMTHDEKGTLNEETGIWSCTYLGVTLTHDPSAARD